MEYRREIDGLRALAVLPVMFFHAGFDAFSGGFVGVDVFFVISGYLITSIIFAENKSGTFSLIKFYERRIRRILPALFFVMAVCIPFAWFWLLPTDMRGFSQSLVAVPLFASNFLFWHQSGYFETAAELKPLLHTWSLAVEEQYYVLFPLFIMLTMRLGKRWIVGILVVVALISLVFAQWGAYENPAATFFLLPSRGWELAIGAFIALYLEQRECFAVSNAVRQSASIAGLLLIFYAVFAFSKETPFPSLYALVPTIGTALVISFGTSKTIVGAALGTKSLVRLGLISYSAYLWHQPMLVFARHRWGIELPPLLLLTLLVVTLLLAYLSWKYIEAPFRATHVINRAAIFRFAILGSIVFIAFGLIGHDSNGFSSVRFSEEEAQKLSSFERSRLETCDFKDCALEGVGESDWLLIGDSNAYHFSVPLKELLMEKGRRLVNLSKAGCIPLLGFEKKDQKIGFKSDCEEHYTNVRKFALSKNSPKNIVISAAWEIYVYGDAYLERGGVPKAGGEQVYPKSAGDLSEKERVRSVLDGIESEILAYARAGKNVVVIGPMPFLKTEIPSGRIRGDWESHYAYSIFEKRNEALIRVFAGMKTLKNVILFRPDDIICPQASQRVCVSAIDGMSLYGDRMHVSDSGARKVFEPFFRSVVKQLN